MHQQRQWKRKTIKFDFSGGSKDKGANFGNIRSRSYNVKSPSLQPQNRCKWVTIVYFKKYNYFLLKPNIYSYS